MSTTNETELLGDAVAEALGSPHDLIVDSAYYLPREINTATLSMVEEAWNTNDVDAVGEDAYYVRLTPSFLFSDSSPHARMVPSGPNTRHDQSHHVWGDSGWKDTDMPRSEPDHVWTRSRLAGDLYVGSFPNMCVIRYGVLLHHEDAAWNWLSKRFKKVADHVVSVTMFDELVRTVAHCYKTRHRGIVHAVVDKPIRLVQLAERVKTIDPTYEFESVLPMQLHLEGHTPGPRPHQVLEVTRLVSFPIPKAAEQFETLFAKMDAAAKKRKRAKPKVLKKSATKKSAAKKPAAKKKSSGVRRG